MMTNIKWDDGVHHLKAIGEFKLQLHSGNWFSDFVSPVTLNFYGWRWKTIGHLFYTLSTYVHHYKAIDEFNLEVQSGNAQFGSKSANLCPVTLKIEGPWKTIGHFCCVKLYASFHSHHWIQTGVTVQKPLIWVKLDELLSHVTLKFDGWPRNTIGQLS